ncbi:hypothetical protein KQI65_09980 [bacterium]|nr:hypothetical protein [bacterium]
MKRTLFPLAAVVFLAGAMTFMGCNQEAGPISPDGNAGPDNSESTLMKVGRGTIWGDCTLFRTVGTPAHFNPNAGNFDELYNVGLVMGEFKDGVGAISESKPGDQDFNGGRWHVNVLKSGVDPFKYDDACSVEDLDLSDFESTSTYFECPLIPMPQNN